MKRIVNSINQTGLFSVVVIAPDVNISTYIAQNSIDSALQIPENLSVEFSKGVISLTYYSNPSNQIASAPIRSMNISSSVSLVKVRFSGEILISLNLSMIEKNSSIVDISISMKSPNLLITI